MAASTSQARLDQLLPDWQAQLQLWAQTGSLVAAAQEALILSGTPSALQGLINQWSAGDFSGLPPIVLLSASDISGAMGAYAISTGTIYLNADWLATATQDQANAVLTEELGHHLDGLLNAVDTPGDEGEYFAKLAQGVSICELQKKAIRGEVDAKTISIDGGRLPVEQASVIIRGNSIYRLQAAPSKASATSIAADLGGYLIVFSSSGEYDFIQAWREPIDKYTPGSNYYVGHKWDPTSHKPALLSQTSSANEANIDWLAQSFDLWQREQSDPGFMNDLGENAYYGGINDAGKTGLILHVPSSGFAIVEDDISGVFADGDHSRSALVEIPINSSIARFGAVKEGAGLFTTSINLSAGTQTSGNLAEGATVYWSITGITDADLASGSLTGSGTITNGKVEIQHSLKQDGDTGEQFSVSVYSDNARTQQIGSTNSVAVQEGTPLIRGNSAYSIVSGPSWQQAEVNAEILGGTLTSISDSLENRWITETFDAIIPTNEGLWIGLRFNPNTSRWEWRNGEALAFTAWYPGEPSRTLQSDGITREDSAHIYLTNADASGWHGRRGYWNDIPSGAPISPEGKGIAEIPLLLSITRSGAIKEGAAPFTTSIKLSAGTQPSGNLAEGATVYWSISGITADDLTSGSLTGSDTINNGKLDIQHSLKADADTGEQFSVSVYSDAARTLQIGTTSSIAIQESNQAPSNITLSTSGVLENSAGGTLIGTLSATDPDVASSFTYALVPGNGSNDTDNALVEIVGNQLRVKAGAVIDYETNASLQLNIRVTDNGSPALSYAKAFNVDVLNQTEPAAGPIIRGNSFYTVVSGPSWKEAEENAAIRGGHLVTIENSDENRFLKDAFAANKENLYIGFNDISSVGSWLWSSGIASTYSEWRTQPEGGWAEPNNYWGNEDVAMMYLNDTWNGYWNDVSETGINGYGQREASRGIAEIPLILSITRTGTVKEGTAPFTTSINLSAGTQVSGNLAEGATVYWSITGITADDLVSGSLTGSGTIANGKLDIHHSLKVDADTGEQFSVSVYSDPTRTQLIGATSSVAVQEGGQVLRGNSLYRLTPIGKWTDGESAAVQLGGHLVTINDAAENAWILQNIAGDAGGGWIGFYQTGAGTGYRWVSGELAAYTNWGQGLPDFPSWEFYSYMGGGNGLWGDCNNTGDGNGGLLKGIAEIPLILSITRTGTVKEGTAPFTTSINLSAGTQVSGNLAEGATAYWSITGITDADLASGSLTGSGTITNGKLDIQHYLKVDADTGEQFSVSVYSDPTRTQLIGATYSVVVQEALQPSNNAPTDISLTSSGILENSPAGTLIGTLAATDPDQGSSFTYELVQGNGSNDIDNALVDIVGNQLRVKAGALIDYETNASLQLNIRVTDNGSPALSFTKAFSVNVGNVNEAPTDISLTSSGILENSPAGTLIGTLAATDPDQGSSFTYELVQGNGSTDADNALVDIVGNQLRVKAGAVIDYETNASLQLNIRVTDNGSPALSFTKAFSVNVGDVNEVPPANPVDDQSYTLDYSVDGYRLATTGKQNLSVLGADKLKSWALWGDDQSNRLIGGSKEDVLIGGGETDYLTGGLGSDTFVMTDWDQRKFDFITDFNAKDDAIGISKYMMDVSADASVEVVRYNDIKNAKTAQETFDDAQADVYVFLGSTKQIQALQAKDWTQGIQLVVDSKRKVITYDSDGNWSTGAQTLAQFTGKFSTAWTGDNFLFGLDIPL